MDQNDYGATSNRFYDIKNFLRDSNSNFLVGSSNSGPFFRDQGRGVLGVGGPKKVNYTKNKSVIFRGMEFGFNYMTDISKTPNVEEKTFSNYDYIKNIRERDSDRREKFGKALGRGLGQSLAVDRVESSENLKPRQS